MQTENHKCFTKDELSKMYQSIYRENVTSTFKVFDSMKGCQGCQTNLNAAIKENGCLTDSELWQNLETNKKHLSQCYICSLRIKDERFNTPSPETKNFLNILFDAVYYEKIKDSQKKLWEDEQDKMGKGRSKKND